MADSEFDVVVVGAGAAGMTAALAATRNGLSVLLVERAPQFGGSTARSGGGVWAPGNEVLQRAGVVDTPQAAATYLADIVAGDSTPQLQAAFLHHAPAMLSLVLAATPLRFRWVQGYADYYPEVPGGMPGGRSIEPVPMVASMLGSDRGLLAPPYVAAKGGLAITQREYRWLNLLARHPVGVATAARVGVRSVLARARRRELLTMGQALAAGLWVGLTRHQVPVWLSTSLVDLVTDGGRVTGVRVRRDGADLDVLARRGVVLAAGGFEHDEELRHRYQREPIGTAWTTGARGNTGDGIRAGRRLGAGLDLMDDAWWGPSVLLPRGPYFLLAERTLPGCILVNAAGRRFVNEAAPYVDAVHAMYDAHTDQTPHIPSWLVFDQRYRDRYLFAARGPRQPFPDRWYRSGAVVRAGSMDKLAAEIGVPGEALAATVKRFNAFAERGRDDDYARGESAYDRYYGDPRNRPNPCLGQLSKAPFYAVRIVPGDLGTKGGLTTDARSRVLHEDGSVLEGLYAAGNTAASVMGRTYAGPGATLGPAMTFGYVAGMDLAGRL